MGGFMFNGCGATDSFYKVRDVGSFFCPGCKETRVFSLFEVKRKIRVVYIPTVPISVKYAVSCSACRDGYYISEQQKDDILYGRVDIEVTSNSVIFHKKQGTDVCPEIPKDIEPKKDIDIRTDEQELDQRQEEPIPRFCSKCGSRLDIQTGICMNCDSEPAIEEKNKQDIDSSEKSATEQRFAGRLSQKICPDCGLIYFSDKETCSVCGRELKIRE